MATAHGRQLLDRPAELWSTVAAETEEGGDFPLAVTEAVGLRLLHGLAEVHQLAADVHPVLVAQGWSSGGNPIALDQVASAIYIPIRWWKLFGVLDQEESRWDRETRRPLNPHTYGLRPDGESMVLGFLRARAVRPRHSVQD